MGLRVDLDVATPSTMSATSVRIRRVARHGAQNAVENCTSVARPSRLRAEIGQAQTLHVRPSPPMSAALRCGSATPGREPWRERAPPTATYTPVITAQGARARTSFPQTRREQPLPVRRTDLDRLRSCRLGSSRSRRTRRLAAYCDLPAARDVPPAVLVDRVEPAVALPGAAARRTRTSAVPPPFGLRDDPRAHAGGRVRSRHGRGGRTPVAAGAGRLGDRSRLRPCR